MLADKHYSSAPLSHLHRIQTQIQTKFLCKVACGMAVGLIAQCRTLSRKRANDVLAKTIFSRHGDFSPSAPKELL